MDSEPEDSVSGWIAITVTHRKQNYTFDFPDDATVPDLFDEIAESLDIPPCNQKIFVSKGPLLKAPFQEPYMALENLRGKTLTLMGSGAAAVQAVQSMSEKVAARNAARMAQKAKMKKIKQYSRQSTAGLPEDAKYTFLQVRPLQGLPKPERSQLLLMRLKEDPGIKAAMKKHKFTVSLLTEMEPLSHTETTHEGTSRILGLNRNQGEVIELRLRTDAHDGYRDYKTIRNTLCHELAHNVHGPHDRQFWDLCHQIERDVHAADWKSNGHTIGETSRYIISGQAGEDGDHEDDGGWTGGEFVLGGAMSEAPGLSRREVLAQAALERQRKEDGAERKACDAAEKGWRPCQRSQQSSDKSE
ncbi:hypothetical protein QQS21_004555 [Conoideocrella luteorostrata]|uniref:WLM domain-containing protein n=1 Tax=Conoideocrella luteorostrata TaxID=1105319 RepID=A0AAJ0CU44_9HYPO|nr:hypothetical protein QQS21_004555 [Conoideocrella luteorostrata]